MTARRVGDRDIEVAIGDALDRRGPGKSICPSEAARALSQDWRPLMPEVRLVAQEMADRGALAVTQKGRPVRADAAKGPIRLARPKPQDPD